MLEFLVARKKEAPVPESILRIQKNKNVTLPRWVMELFRVSPGDFIRIERRNGTVVLHPAKLVDPSQTYFWTPQWQEGERKVEEEKRKGKAKFFRSAEDLIKDLRR